MFLFKFLSSEITHITQFREIIFSVSNFEIWYKSHVFEVLLKQKSMGILVSIYVHYIYDERTLNMPHNLLTSKGLI